MKRIHPLLVATALFLVLVVSLFVFSCSKLKLKGASEKFKPDLVLVYWGELMGQLDPSG